MKENYKQLIKTKGHMPTGILNQGFPIGFITNFLEDNLRSNESFLDITGVRFQGKDSFLVLTSERLICVHHKGDIILTKDCEVFLALDYTHINKISIAPQSGIVVKAKDNDEFNLYFVQPEKGQEFSESLEDLGIDTENLTIIPSDKHEKTQIYQAIGGFIVIALLFAQCAYNAATSPESASFDTEACVRRYVQGDTVEKHEIEEAYRNCRH
ncbi:hypothetical protein Lepto7375DRAFT_0571 [Leptolyngbya sp. PCC 7375]|nr:hypothetical protein Lepto7375DRAFT_0571 [Leptolyngbya sp. PCC 7375]